MRKLSAHSFHQSACREERKKKKHCRNSSVETRAVQGASHNEVEIVRRQQKDKTQKFVFFPIPFWMENYFG